MMMNVEGDSPLAEMSDVELRQLLEAQGVTIPADASREQLTALVEEHCMDSSSSSFPMTRATEGSSDSTMVKLEGVDFMCAVCTELFFRPVTIPCGHSFCEACLTMALSYKPQCPMCREVCTLSPVQFKTNVLLATIIEQSFKDTYAKRAQEMAKQAQLLQGKKKLIIGNTHEIVPSSSQNQHKWKFFCTVLNMDERLGASAPSVPASSYIQRVEVNLHPTFRPNKLVLSDAPFEFTRIGWGVFMLRGTVHFLPKYNMRPIAFEHMLSFERNGTHREYHISFGA